MSIIKYHMRSDQKKKTKKKNLNIHHRSKVWIQFLLFNKDALDSSKVTVNIFIMLQKIWNE